MHDLPGIAVFGLIFSCCSVAYTLVCLAGLAGTILAYFCWNFISFIGCCGKLTTWRFPRKGTWARVVVLTFIGLLGTAVILFVLLLMPTFETVFSVVGLFVLLSVHNILKVAHSPSEGPDPALPDIRQLVTPRLWTLQRTSILLETVLVMCLTVYGYLYLWSQAKVGLPARYGYSNFITGLWATGPRLIYRRDFATTLLSVGIVTDVYLVPMSTAALVIIHSCHFARRREVQFQIRRLEKARRKTVSALQCIDAAHRVGNSSDIFTQVSMQYDLASPHVEVTTTAPSEAPHDDSFVIRLNKAALGADRDRNVCSAIGVLLCLTSVSGVFVVR